MPSLAYIRGTYHVYEEVFQGWMEESQTVIPERRKQTRLEIKEIRNLEKKRINAEYRHAHHPPTPQHSPQKTCHPDSLGGCYPASDAT